MKDDSGRIQFAAEKLSRARHALMLPHCEGEAGDIAEAFLFCSQAFDLLNSVNLDDRERGLFKTVRKLMDTSGIEKSSEGAWVIRARRLTLDQKLQLTGAVDDLAHLFERRYWKVEYGRAGAGA